MYSQLAKECISHRICIDLYLAISTGKSVDLASIAPIADNTGGDLHYFPNYDETKHGEKLYYLLYRMLTRQQGYDIQVKARTSTGITQTEYYGSFAFVPLADFEIAAIDADKTVSFVVRNDERLKDNQIVYVQFAMIYTNVYGERRIRVLNQSLPVAKNLNFYFKSADVEAVA